LPPPGVAAAVGVVTRPVGAVPAGGGAVWLGRDWSDGPLLEPPAPDVAVPVAVVVDGGCEVADVPVGSDVVGGSVGVSVAVDVGVGVGLPGVVVGREGVGSTGAAYAVDAPPTPAPVGTGSTTTTPTTSVPSGSSIVPTGSRRRARRRPECRPMGRSLPRAVLRDTAGVSPKQF
jgi:hypothetical protein